jgi:hypothetical protein
MSREDEIKLLAYSLWEQEGRQEGFDNKYWPRAENIWVEKNPGTKTKKTGAGPKQKTRVNSTSKRS